MSEEFMHSTSKYLVVILIPKLNHIDKRMRMPEMTASFQEFAEKNNTEWIYVLCCF
jgi:hypothetical protein